MIIDFHTHIFPDKIAARTIGLLEEKSGLTAATDGTPRGLLKSMEKAGITMSVVLPVATKPSQFESIRMYAGSVNTQYPEKLLSFGGVHPDCADYKNENGTDYVYIINPARGVQNLTGWYPVRRYPRNGEGRTF